MIWTYRVFRDQTNRYSVREVFYERDGTIIGYGKSPVALVGDSPEEILQLITWFREAFNLPILSMEATNAQITAQPHQPDQVQRSSLSFDEVRAALSAEADAVKE